MGFLERGGGGKTWGFMLLKVASLLQESSSSWLDSVLCHMADIILLEDTPSIQMEVAILVKEFPDIR